MTLDTSAYREFFARHTGCRPYAYQVRAAEMLAQRKNLVVAAPTGAGKTLTVLAPFFFDGWVDRPMRLIYAVPLRTLAQGIHGEARTLAARLGHDPDGFVKLQTGEQPDDPFFALGRIIVTTYDQVLSGLLSGPYGLSSSLHNINSAAIAGALVVFDEFHLMEPVRAFLTGAAGLHLFRDLSQCVWMTATATSPLVEVLRSATGAVDASPSAGEIVDLPTVAGVFRSLQSLNEPLSAGAVLKASEGRTIVICNTVPRAQAMYRDLRRLLPDDVPMLLVHSRFFKPDRADKVAQLPRLFGKGCTGRAVLVATQVIEAGVDISCDDLHTELCPMNALIQRAGRCARYANEVGTVHVYQPATVERWWLPYGELDKPDPALAATADVLREHTHAGAQVTPATVAGWIERVHGEADSHALGGGWRPRLDEILRRIYTKSVLRQPIRIADLIREESVDEVPVVVARERELPDPPGTRESVTISRWQLRALAQPESGTGFLPRAWVWAFGAPDEGRADRWEPLRDEAQLRRALMVCLSPEVARYTSDVGLEVGPAGETTSPPRSLPKRPGYKPLHRETWAAHAQAVAREAERRAMEVDGLAGFLGAGLGARYGLNVPEVRSAARTVGLFHDLGKLQRSWQRWAEAWQRTKEVDYVHVDGLAHTDFDPENPADREANRRFRPPRPPHAPASALVACGLLGEHLAVADERQGLLVSASLASILAHHGGWLPDGVDMGVDQLWERWQRDLAGAGIARLNAAVIEQLYQRPDRGAVVRSLLEIAINPDELEDSWPLVAYLSRTLRLADQRATAEGGEGVS
ncbi:MAG TPA: CRISPR-associated helicase Cas3' [Chloroflexota bacterium]|nr:CRISPR-associated helicase Cas3' [Chloroflexota bacterium]